MVAGYKDLSAPTSGTPCKPIAVAMIDPVAGAQASPISLSFLLYRNASGPGLWAQMTYFTHQSIPLICCTRSVNFRNRFQQGLQLAYRPHVLHTTSHCANSKSACCPPSPLNRAVRRSAVAVLDASWLIRRHDYRLSTVVPSPPTSNQREQSCRQPVHLASSSRVETRRGCSFHAHPPHPARLWLSLEAHFLLPRGSPCMKYHTFGSACGAPPPNHSLTTL